MTPHPDSITPETSITDALKKMHRNKYLHLPIIKDGRIYGMADVVKLTYYLLKQLNEFDNPIWKKFWSEDHVDTRVIPPVFEFDDNETIAPDDSASMVPDNRKKINLKEGELFCFKFKDEVANKNYRLTTAINDLDALKSTIALKVFQIYGGNIHKSLLHLVYLDDDDDFVYLENDRDLEDGVLLAKVNGWRSLVVMLDRSRMEFLGNPLKADLDIKQPFEPGFDLVFPTLISGVIAIASVILLVRSTLK